jgi:hypothetical protein
MRRLVLPAVRDPGGDIEPRGVWKPVMLLGRPNWNTSEVVAVRRRF